MALPTGPHRGPSHVPILCAVRPLLNAARAECSSCLAVPVIESGFVAPLPDKRGCRIPSEMKPQALAWFRPSKMVRHLSRPPHGTHCLHQGSLRAGSRSQGGGQCRRRQHSSGDLPEQIFPRSAKSRTSKLPVGFAGEVVRGISRDSTLPCGKAASSRCSWQSCPGVRGSTTTSISPGRGRCRSFTSGQSPVTHRSTSAGVVKSTGIAFPWIGKTISSGGVNLISRGQC